MAASLLDVAGFYRRSRGRHGPDGPDGVRGGKAGVGLDPLVRVDDLIPVVSLEEHEP